MKKYSKATSVLLITTMLVASLPAKAVSAENNVESNNKNQLQIESKPKNEPKIITEIKEKRSEYTKTFLLDDMSYEAVMYNEPVHYLVNGKWEDIDNSMTEQEGNSDNEPVEEVAAEPNLNLNSEMTINVNDIKNDEIDNSKNQDENSVLDSSQKLNKVANKSKVFTNKKNDFSVDISKASEAKKLVTLKRDKYQFNFIYGC